MFIIKNLKLRIIQNILTFKKVRINTIKKYIKVPEEKFF